MEKGTVNLCMNLKKCQKVSETDKNDNFAPEIFFFFGNTVKARMSANTHNAQQGEQETIGAGEGRKKQWGTET